MADMGTDAGQASVTLSVKLIELLSKLLDTLHKQQGIKLQNEAAKLQIDEIKDLREKKKAVYGLNGVYGYVTREKMLKTGKPMDLCSNVLTQDEYGRFAQYAKRSGLVYTALTENGAGEGKQTYLIEFFKEDTEKLKNIFDTIAKEATVAEIDREIERVKAKPEISEADKGSLERLEKIRADIINAKANEFNAKQNEAVANNGQFVTFNEAVNHYTNHLTNDSSEKFICERNRPDDYIVSKSVKDIDVSTGKPYKKTFYSVFKDNRKVLERDDGRHNGGPKSPWPAIRAEMKRAGGFSDNLVMFNNRDDFEKYRNEMNKYKAARKDTMEKLPEYAEIQNELKKISVAADYKNMQKSAFLSENDEAYIALAAETALLENKKAELENELTALEEKDVSLYSARYMAENHPFENAGGNMGKNAHARDKTPDEYMAEAENMMKMKDAAEAMPGLGKEAPNADKAAGDMDLEDYSR